MMINKYIVSLFFCTAALAQDETEELRPNSTDGLINSKMEVKFCSESKFNYQLRDILSEDFSHEIKDLPKPFFKLIATHMLEKDKELDINDWKVVKPGEMVKSTSPEHNQVFAAYGLIDDVAVFIYSQAESFFIHRDNEESTAKKLNDYINSFPKDECRNAFVTLVTGGYSKVFSSVYTTLKSRGFSNMSVDIEPVVIRRLSANEIRVYVKASTESSRPEAVMLRSLIVHAQLGEVYMFHNYPHRSRDIERIKEVEKGELTNYFNDFASLKGLVYSKPVPDELADTFK